MVNRGSLGGVFTLAAGTSMSVAGAGNFPSNYSSYILHNTSTVIYNGTIAQTINGITYGNLVVSNGGTNAKTLGGTINVNGNIILNNGATMDGSVYSINLGGNWTNSGTFIPSASTVILNGTAKTISGNTTFNRVSVLWILFCSRFKHRL